MYDETVSHVILCQLKHGLDYFLHSVELIFKLRTVTNIYPSFSLLFQLKFISLWYYEVWTDLN